MIGSPSASPLPTPEVQALLSAIVESSDDAIVSKTLEGIVTSWNRAAERIFGFTAEEMIGQSITKIIPDDRLDEEPEILRRIGSGERVDHFETIRRRKDGRLINVAVTISPVRDSAGTIVGASKVARDITEQKRLEEELQQRAIQIELQNEELERRNEALLDADRQKNQFLAMLAHELRNPLAPVVTSLHLLKAQQDLHPTVRRCSDIMGRQIGHMSRLLDDLLDVSRLTRGTIELRKEVLDLGALVGSVAQALEDYADEREHRVEVRLPRTPVQVEGDPTRLNQVVTNLLNNAVKFTDRGGRIEVEVARDGDQAVIRVRDNGPGIPPPLLSRIFDVFVQGEQGLARSRGGLGIGLTVVKNVAELHGGTVQARSAGPGKGAEFIVRLPAIPADLPQPGPESNGSASGNGKHHCRVLVVDDSEDAGTTLAELARVWGHEADAVRSGRAALDTVPTFKPDLILLDIGMPRMDGYEVAQRLRGDLAYSGRIVALTGYGHVEDRGRALSAGCDAHMTKPVDPDQLRELLDA